MRRTQRLRTKGMALLFTSFPAVIQGATTATLSNCGIGRSSGNNATCIGSTITTGLSWSNPGGDYAANQIPYTGVTIGVTGGHGSRTSPYVWTLSDENENEVTRLTTGGVQWVATPFGQIDCTGSPDNSSCVYNAPGDTTYRTPTATLTISDGSTAAAVRIVFASPLNASTFFTSRGRLLGFNGRPVNLLAANPDAADIVFRQSEWTVFENTQVPGTEVGIIDGLNNDPCSGTQFPVTAGSSISRPAWSANGEWFNFMDNEVLPAFFNQCNGLTGWIVKSTGSEKLRVDRTAGFHFMWDAIAPNWAVSTDGAYPESGIFVYDVSRNMEKTKVAAYKLVRGNGTGLTVNTFPSGSHFAFAQRNLGNGCTPGPTCSPDIVTYDLGPCYASLRTGCGKFLNVFNIFLNANGYEEGGAPLRLSVQAGLHDWNYLRDGTNRIVFLYGPRGDVGQGIWFIVNEDGTGVAPFSPRLEANVPYFSHPAFNGHFVAYGGRQSCVSPRNIFPTRKCNDELYGNGIMDLRETSKGAFAFSQNVAYGHAAWDGWNPHLLEHDNAGGDVVNGCFSETISETTVGSGPLLEEKQFFNWECRPSNREGNSAVRFVYGPTQSPDATKFAEAMLPSMSRGSTYLGWVFYARKPEPPTLAFESSKSVSLAITPSPLSYEAQYYVIYKQPDCFGPWSAIATLKAVFKQVSPYSFLDQLGLRNGQRACYGATQVDWSNIESDQLSNILQVSSTAGNLSATKEGNPGTKRFETATPNKVSKLSIKKKQICAAGCAGANRPTEPQSISIGPEGSMLAGKYWVMITYTQSPNPSSYHPVLETLPSRPKMIKIASQAGASLIIETYNKEMVGQMGARFYLAGPSESEPPVGQFHLQTCNTSYAIDAHGAIENPKGTQATIVAGSMGSKFYGVRPGNTVTISGVVNSAFDGPFTVISTDQYQFSQSGNGSFLVSNSAPLASTISGGGMVTLAQSDFVLPMPSRGSYAVCSISSLRSDTSTPPSSNTTVGGYMLSWTEPSPSTAVRFYQIYRGEGEAPEVANETKAQQWLLSTQSVGSSSYYDYTPNLSIDATKIHYAIITKDRHGNRSSGVCMNGAGVSEICN